MYPTGTFPGGTSRFLICRAGGIFTAVPDSDFGTQSYFSRLPLQGYLVSVTRLQRHAQVENAGCAVRFILQLGIGGGRQTHILSFLQGIRLLEGLIIRISS